MITRRFLLQSSAASAAYLASAVWPARAANAPGVTNTEIKIGPDHALQRAGLSMGRDRPHASRLLQDDQ